MNFDEMAQAVDQAEQTMRLADRMASRLARLLIGRLRKVDSWVLRDLKRELRDFNMQSREWRP